MIAETYSRLKSAVDGLDGIPFIFGAEIGSERVSNSSAPERAKRIAPRDGSMSA